MDGLQVSKINWNEKNNWALEFGHIMNFIVVIFICLGANYDLKIIFIIFMVWLTPGGAIAKRLEASFRFLKPWDFYPFQFSPVFIGVNGLPLYLVLFWVFLEPMGCHFYLHPSSCIRYGILLHVKSAKIEKSLTCGG